jgi:hypothetical protein
MFSSFPIFKWVGAEARTPEFIHFVSFRPVRDGLILARHFSAGIIEETQISPVGTTDWRPQFPRNTTKDMFGDEFNRPYGTPSKHPITPALKCRAKFISSLTGRESAQKMY